MFPSSSVRLIHIPSSIVRKNITEQIAEKFNLQIMRLTGQILSARPGRLRGHPLEDVEGLKVAHSERIDMD